MPQLLAHRVAVRAAQFAIAAAGIIFLLLLFSRQAHAATGDGAPRGRPRRPSAVRGPGVCGRGASRPPAPAGRAGPTPLSVPALGP